ncbi:MAG TPA: YafY family protein [Candidatus Limnocylindrales bacterium]|jgi:predicted DNA-binding transcriptional regulator YafY|nr:YafY family protein [Candidatus Limnocylindrales bacterium]
MRASRLVNLLLLLQSRGGMTATELARELEVSVRTIHRDVEELSAAGVPIFAERGPLGGIRLVDGYRTRLTGMTADEAEALFLSGVAGPAAQLGLGTVVAAAQLKVMAALPPELRSRASRIVQRFHLDAAGWFQADESVPHLATLSTGVWESRALAVDYDRGNEVVERVIGPLGLVLKGGIWYVIALVEGQIRTYRASRVVEARLLDEPVARPDDFDLAAYWTESSAAYEREAPRVDVDVRVREDQAWRINQVFGRGTVAASQRVDETDHPGTIRLRLRLSYPDEAPGMLLAVGPNLEVIDPPEVRDKLVLLATRIVDRYRQTAAPDAGR